MSFLVASFLLFSSHRALAAETELKVTDLPQPVQAAIASTYAGWTVGEASTEKEDGQQRYEAGIKLADRSLDVAFSADGKLLEEEEMMAITALPAPVQATIVTYKGWTAKRAERSTANGATAYEVLLEQGKKRMEIAMDAAGAVKSKENADGEN